MSRSSSKPQQKAGADYQSIGERLGRIAAVFYRRYPEAVPRLLEVRPAPVIRCSSYRDHALEHRLESGVWTCPVCRGT